MNIYTNNLNRIEFMMTLACTGKCKHCSEGMHDARGTFIKPDIAAEVVRKVADQYRIESLMTFGGEPLLQWESVCCIHAAARKAKIPQRQLITNGYFTKDSDKIGMVARELGKSGVNAILLSVDAFHQETIPLKVVKEFAGAVKKEAIYVRTHPAWLGGEEAENPYNQETKRILKEFDLMEIAASEGNTIFPAGNALEFLKEYFNSDNMVDNPYVEDSRDIRSICIGPEGNVLGENIYQKDILDILSDYVPE